MLQTKANSCETSHKINKCNKINYRKRLYQLWVTPKQSAQRESEYIPHLTAGNYSDDDTLFTQMESVYVCIE